MVRARAPRARRCNGVRISNFEHEKRARHLRVRVQDFVCSVCLVELGAYCSWYSLLASPPLPLPGVFVPVEEVGVRAQLGPLVGQDGGPASDSVRRGEAQSNTEEARFGPMRGDVVIVAQLRYALRHSGQDHQWRRTSAPISIAWVQNIVFVIACGRQQFGPACKPRRVSPAL